jgi:hypothetical protein
MKEYGNGTILGLEKSGLRASTYKPIILYYDKPPAQHNLNSYFFEYVVAIWHYY